MRYMKPDEFQKEARDAAQIVHTRALVRMAEALAGPECDPELALKVYNATKDVAQAVPKEKVDPYANLPVFHIHMHNGRVLGEVRGSLPSADVSVIDMASGHEDEEQNIELLSPTGVMHAAARLINAELTQDQGKELFE